jgi:hypothetical protein
MYSAFPYRAPNLRENFIAYFLSLEPQKSSPPSLGNGGARGITPKGESPVFRPIELFFDLVYGLAVTQLGTPSLAARLLRVTVPHHHRHAVTRAA